MPKIPHLRDVHYGFGLEIRVPKKFVELFVTLHRKDFRSDDWAWQQAQLHWEGVVAEVLNTDAVDTDAQGDIAIWQAVVASYGLLESFAQRGRCPVCPAPARHAGDRSGSDDIG